MTGHDLTSADYTAARKTAITIDLLAVGASLAANVAAAPVAVGGWLIAAIAPAGLFALIVLWHRSHGVVSGWLGRLFSAGLGLIAAGAGWISYGHLREVALAAGQTESAAAIIPLVIDGAAILATLVIVSAGRGLARLVEAERLAAIDRTEVEAARLAAIEADQIEADRVAAELATAQLATEAERTRLAAAEAEATAAREQRLAARTAPVNARAEIGAGGKLTKPAANTGARRSAEETSELVADYLALHPEAKQAEVAEALGMTAKTVQRSQAWQDHKNAKAVAA